MTSGWRCDDCLTVNGDPRKPCAACGGSRRRAEPSGPLSAPAWPPAGASWAPPSSAPASPAPPSSAAQAPPSWTAPAAGPGASAARTYHVSSRPPSHRLRLLLTTAVVIVGILVAVVLVVTNREQDGPDPGAARSVGAGSAQGGGPDRRDESEQADAAAARRMDALLTESIAGRRYLLEAIDQALACDTSAASRGMRAASQARTDLIAKAGDTDLAALPGGDDLKSGLIGFLRASYTADQAYLRWVRSADGCPSTGGAGFPAVERANAEARSRKTGFLADWNPVAERFGLPTRDVKSI